MKTISSIKWTDRNIWHIARHAVTPEENEEICFDEYEPPFIRAGRGSVYYVFGKTYSGRYLFIVVRFIRHGEVKVITVRDMNTWEKNYFKRRGK